MKRIHFIQSTVVLPFLPLIGFKQTSEGDKSDLSGNRFKLSLNAYSFNAQLRSGTISLHSLLEFCAAQGFDASDLTGYYFPGYPNIPTDEYIYQIKRKAHQLGVAISGTGIRNDFTQPDQNKRLQEVTWIKSWIDVAAKLGAPVIRIFTGNKLPENYSRETVTEWMTKDIKTCVAYGKDHGVIVAVQHHNDFIKTADQAIDLIKRVNSDWFGLVVDSGSFVTNEPYSEIAKAAPHAVNWQIKEFMNYKGKVEPMDLNKLFKIINASPYRGYLPIETLSPGDPHDIIPPFLKKVKDALNQATKI